MRKFLNITKKRFLKHLRKKERKPKPYCQRKCALVLKKLKDMKEIQRKENFFKREAKLPSVTKVFLEIEE
jgi:hypothetical protein